MYRIIYKQIKPAFLSLVFLSVLTGLAYPLLMVLIGETFFKVQAEGSLIVQNDQIIGSHLLGQEFTSPQYFWGRPSATLNYAYNTLGSQGSNFGPSNPKFFNVIKQRIVNLQKAHPKQKNLVPIDLVTSSASGLDPEISPLAIYYQLDRVAKARKISSRDLSLLVTKLTKHPSFGFLGEPRVNVLELNMELDKIATKK